MSSQPPPNTSCTLFFYATQLLHNHVDKLDVIIAQFFVEIILKAAFCVHPITEVLTLLQRYVFLPSSSRGREP